MNQRIIQYLKEYFSRLIREYGFIVKNTIVDGNTISIVYSSEIFDIKIEKYWHEFNLTMVKSQFPEKEINLFNLIDYLKLSPIVSSKPEKLIKETDIEEFYRKQLLYLSNIIYTYYNNFYVFFSNKNFESEFDKIEKYVIDKNPDLFRKIQ